MRRLLVFLALTALAYGAPKPEPKLDRPIVVRIIGASMLPSIKEGDHVVIVPKSYDALQPGDVVMFRNYRTGSYVLHRLLRKKARGWVTKGDNNRRFDLFLVSERNYVGVLNHVIASK